MQKASEIRQIIVLGMHRSGTSAVTGALSGMGVFVGERDELTRPLKENPRGFFERRDARMICDALLHDAGADWWKVSGFDPHKLGLPLTDRHRESIVGLLNELDSHGQWALKEPRLCVLFSLFRPWLQRPLLIIVLRHPVEVAKSLRDRNGFPMRVGMALWEFYTLSALKAAQGEKRYVVRHSRLLEDPVYEIGNLADWLESQGVQGLDRMNGARVIDPALLRQRHSSIEADGWMPESVAALWQRLCEDEAAGDLPSVSANSIWTLLEFESDYERNLSIKREMVELRTQVADSRTEEAKWKHHFEHSHEEASELRERLAESTEEVGALKRQLAQSKAESVRLKEKISSLKDESKGMRKQVERFRSEVEEARNEEPRVLEKLRKRYERALSQVRDDLNELRYRFDTVRSEAGELARQLQMQDATISAICPVLHDDAPEGINWSDRVTVSVIVVAESGSMGLIAACLSELERQSWPRWELVVVHDPAKFDDGGESTGIVDPRVRLVSYSGTSRLEAVSRGIEACSGDLAAHWEVDGTWDRHHFAEAVAAFQLRPDAVAFLGKDDENHEALAPGLECLVYRVALAGCLEASDFGERDDDVAGILLGHCALPVIGRGGRVITADRRPMVKANEAGSCRPRRDNVRLVVGPDLAEQPVVEEWLAAFGLEMDIAVTRWTMPISSVSASDLRARSQAAETTHSVHSAAELLGSLGESVVEGTANWLVVLGNSPVARLQALLSRYHADCRVTIVSMPNDASGAPNLDPLECELESMVSSCLDRIDTTQRSVRPSVLVLDGADLNVPASLLQKKLAFIDRIQCEAGGLPPPIEQLAREFSRWSDTHGNESATSGSE